MTGEEPEGAGLVQPGEGKAKGHLSAVYQYLRGGYGEYRARLSTGVYVERAKSSKCKVIEKSFSTEKRKHFFSMNSVHCWNRSPREAVPFLSLGGFKLRLGQALKNPL